MKGMGPGGRADRRRKIRHTNEKATTTKIPARPSVIQDD